MLAIFRRAAFAVAPAVLVAGAVSALTGTADAGTASAGLVRGQQSQQCQSTAGAQPSCGFATQLQLPLAMAVTAQASPERGQSATVAWQVSCTVGGSALASSSGSKTGTTPFHVQLTLPKSESGNCTVNATVKLGQAGGLTGVLAYTLGQQVMVSVPTGTHNLGAPLATFMCMIDSRETHTPGATAVLGDCKSTYVAAWTYNGKTIKHGGLCLTDPHDGWVGTKLVLNKCTGKANQTWTYKGSGQGTGPFVLKYRGLCLDDTRYTKVLNTPITVFSCNGGPDEDWTLSS